MEARGWEEAAGAEAVAREREEATGAEAEAVVAEVEAVVAGVWVVAEDGFSAGSAAPWLHRHGGVARERDQTHAMVTNRAARRRTGPPHARGVGLGSWQLPSLPPRPSMPTQLPPRAQQGPGSASQPGVGPPQPRQG